LSIPKRVRPQSRCCNFQGCRGFPNRVSNNRKHGNKGLKQERFLSIALLSLVREHTAITCEQQARRQIPTNLGAPLEKSPMPSNAHQLQQIVRRMGRSRHCLMKEHVIRRGDGALHARMTTTRLGGDSYGAHNHSWTITIVNLVSSVARHARKGQTSGGQKV
jgi:hypothetical protein